jgi:hypothetical protein
MPDLDQEELQLQLVEVKQNEKFNELDPKSYTELSKMVDEVLSIMAERQKRRNDKKV